MHTAAYEPQVSNWEMKVYLEIGCLLLTPGKIEAGAQFEQIGPVSIE